MSNLGLRRRNVIDWEVNAIPVDQWMAFLDFSVYTQLYSFLPSILQPSYELWKWLEKKTVRSRHVFPSLTSKRFPKFESLERRRKWHVFTLYSIPPNLQSLVGRIGEEVRKCMHEVPLGLSFPYLGVPHVMLRELPGKLISTSPGNYHLSVHRLFPLASTVYSPAIIWTLEMAGEEDGEE